MSSATFQKPSHLTDSLDDVRICNYHFLPRSRRNNAKFRRAACPRKSVFPHVTEIGRTDSHFRFHIRNFRIWMNFFLHIRSVLRNRRKTKVIIWCITYKGFDFNWLLVENLKCWRNYSSRRAGVQFCVEDAVIVTPAGSTVLHLFSLVCLTT
jgi:hypothetical protein